MPTKTPVRTTSVLDHLPPWTRRRSVLIGSGAAAALLIAALLTWIMWPAPQPEPPRARQYLEYTAYLLTGERGITEPDAVPVWSGLQEASLATHAKVQYLAITGPQTVENGVPFLNSLAMAGCNLVFAAGSVPVATVDSAAAKFPNARFYPVRGGKGRANVFPILDSSADARKAAVNKVLTDAVATVPKTK